MICPETDKKTSDKRTPRQKKKKKTLPGFGPTIKNAGCSHRFSVPGVPLKNILQKMAAVFERGQR